jgi:GAF domain-containing protein
MPCGDEPIAGNLPGGSPVSFFHQIQRKINENLSAQAEDLQTLREQVLNIVLAITSVFGAITLVTNAIPVIQNGDWIFLIIFSIAYLAILISTFVPRIPYTVRSTIIILVPIGLALTDIVDLGLSGDGMVWLFTSALLTSILFGARWTLVNWIIQTIIIFTFAFLITTGRLIVTSPDFSRPIAWIDIAVDYIFLGGLATIGVNILVSGLERSLMTTSNASSLIRSHSTNLERRLNQLRTVAEISRTISGELASQNFLQQLVEVIQERLNLYYVGVFLVDEEKKYAILKAGTGEPGQKMLTQGHSLEIGGKSMISWCITHEQPRIALDAGQEAVRFDNPHLPLTRSELALPLKTANEILGAVTIQSSNPQAFDQDDITVLQGMVDSLATAIINARLFEETQTQVEELNTLYSASLSMYTSVQSRESLLNIAQHMLKVSGTQNYVISSWEEGQDAITTVYNYSPSLGVLEGIGTSYKLSDYPLTEKVLLERRFVTVRMDDPKADAAEIAILKEDGLKSLLMVPLVTHDKVVGLMELHDEIICRDFTPQQVHLVEALSAQVAVVIEITNLFEQNRRTARNEQIINQITSRFQQTLNVEEVMTATIVELSKALGLEEATIQLGLEDELLESVFAQNNGNKLTK